MYHNEVLHCFLDVKLLADRNGIKLPEGMDERIHKMCLATMQHKKPNHLELLMGDSDDIDVRDLLSVGAYLYGDGRLKHAGYARLDFDSVWELGAEAVVEYEANPARDSKYLSAGLMASGNFYMRSGWGKATALCTFSAEPGRWTRAFGYTSF
jgi:hypothetical protein